MADVEAIVDPAIERRTFYALLLASDRLQLVQHHLDNLPTARLHMSRFINVQALTHVLKADIHLFRSDAIQALFNYFVEVHLEELLNAIHTSLEAELGEIVACGKHLLNPLGVYLVQMVLDDPQECLYLDLSAHPRCYLAMPG